MTILHIIHRYRQTSMFQLLPHALETAMEEDVDFRQTLPRDYLNYMGVAFSDEVLVFTVYIEN